MIVSLFRERLVFCEIRRYDIKSSSLEKERWEKC
jgi:hypothetical protein